MEVVRDNMTENKTTLSNDNFYETRKMKFCVFYYFRVFKLLPFSLYGFNVITVIGSSRGGETNFSTPSQ
jgi:hypothetical protein